MTKQDAIKFALEALEKDPVPLNAINNAQYFLRQALAQEQTKCSQCGEVNPAEIHTCSPQVAQEPVAWEKSYDIVCSLLRQAHDILATTQYPIKRPWVGLTVEEIKEILYGLLEDDRTPMLTVIDAVQEKLKEKNT